MMTAGPCQCLDRETQASYEKEIADCLEAMRMFCFSRLMDNSDDGNTRSITKKKRGCMYWEDQPGNGSHLHVELY